MINFLCIPKPVITDTDLYQMKFWPWFYIQAFVCYLFRRTFLITRKEWINLHPSLTPWSVYLAIVATQVIAVPPQVAGQRQKWWAVPTIISQLNITPSYNSYSIWRNKQATNCSCRLIFPSPSETTTKNVPTSQSWTEIYLCIQKQLKGVLP